ncbi:putative B-cell receptor-associated protein 29/31 [Rosa chinensis]|uniref:Endoplasmic reticulum transmembrane protein n=1 Tax=Rosa chinensis TaxID=74649 RepID=A0A2P6Q2I8_ROSCH|nr:B-cell receptor-associated protein 31 [Rosa chinensis]PRQ28395.1 putative B-cell receptor-associated protein 29/31 [Rosa chinensis]
MIQLLFIVIISEMALILACLFKTPLRKLVIMGLDQIKRGRGPVVVKTVAGTVFVVLLTSLYGVMTIKKSGMTGTDAVGILSPTDQILMFKHLLEVTLMGFFLFLVLMIDRIHHYIRELRVRRKTMEAIKKQSRGSEDGKAGGLDEIKALENEMNTSRSRLKQLESDIETKTKEAQAAEANVVTLRKQSEGFLLEYDRLVEENQNLKNQLQSLAHSGSKKDS